MVDYVNQTEHIKKVYPNAEFQTNSARTINNATVRQTIVVGTGAWV